MKKIIRNERSDSMGTIKSFATGFAFGGLVAGAAVLFSTPKSGQELRKQAKTTSGQIKFGFDQIKTDSLALKDDVITVSKNIPAMKDAALDIKTSIDDWRKDTQPNLDSLNEKVKDTTQTMNELESSTQKKSKK